MCKYDVNIGMLPQNVATYTIFAVHSETTGSSSKIPLK